MYDRFILKLDENSNFSYIKCDKFKNSYISFNMFLPLKKETASVYALIPGILEKGCEKYPDFIVLNKKLENLYGASISTEISKIGDYQVLSVFLSSIDERFVINKNGFFSELVDLLIEIIFHPNLIDNYFCDKKIDIEKRQISEYILSELNDKRLLALLECEKMVYQNQVASINKYGYINEINKLTKEEITNKYYELIKESHINVTAIGNFDYENIYEKLKQKLLNFKRNNILKIKNVVNESYKKQINKKNDFMQIEQSKLVMGFNTGVAKPYDIYGMVLATSLIGGTPNSRLFINVREKLNLCYYCTAKYDKHKGTVFIESGVENKNLKKTEEEILRQVQFIKDGNFTNEEIKNNQKYMSQMYEKIDDNINMLDSWYTFNTIYDGHVLSPKEMSEKISNVSKDDIVENAQKINLDSIYIISSK